MFSNINVYQRTLRANSQGSDVTLVKSCEYSRAGFELAMYELMLAVGVERLKLQLSKAWLELEDETGNYVFEVFDADYVNFTLTAAEHLKARRKIAFQEARDKRQGDEAFLAAVNGQPIPQIKDASGNILPLVKAEYESGLRIASEVAALGIV